MLKAASIKKIYTYTNIQQPQENRDQLGIIGNAFCLQKRINHHHHQLRNPDGAWVLDFPSPCAGQPQPLFLLPSIALFAATKRNHTSHPMRDREKD